MPTSLLTLKQETARGYKLRLLTQGTVPTAGTTTLLCDPNRQEPDGEFERVDSWIKFTNGLGAASVNLYLVRRITGFSAAASGNYTITVAPALTASVPSGTTYDIYKNYEPDTDIELAINSAIRDIFGERAVYSVATTVEPSDDTRIVSVPSAAGNQLTQLLRVERPVGSINTDWAWNELIRGADYNVVDYAGSLSITLNYPSVASTVLRLTGLRPAAELAADTDLTEEPSHLIVLGARKFLALQEGDQPAVERWGRELENAKRDYYRARRSESASVPRFIIGG